VLVLWAYAFKILRTSVCSFFRGLLQVARTLRTHMTLMVIKHSVRARGPGSDLSRLARTGSRGLVCWLLVVMASAALRVLPGVRGPGPPGRGFAMPTGTVTASAVPVA